MKNEKSYHKGQFEIAKILLKMSENDFDYMLNLAKESESNSPPSRFMAKQHQGVSFGELDTPSLEFVYIAMKSSKIDLKYKIIAKSCLYKKLKEDESLYIDFYESAEEAMYDFVVEEIESVKPYFESIKKPMLRAKIKGKYDEWKKRVGVEYEDNERGEEDTSDYKTGERLEDNERSNSVSNGESEEEIIEEDW